MNKKPFSIFLFPGCVGLISILISACGGDVSYSFKLGAPLASYLNDQALFNAFSEDYSAYIEQTLKDPGLSLERQKLLQASRVHLAISYADGETALDAAQALKDMQSDPKAKAMTGLLTKAIVAAQEKSTGDLWSPYVIAVQRQFAAQLALVSPGPSLEELQEMNKKYGNMEAGALVNEFLETYQESVDAAGELNLEAADALARVRHKVLDILPLTAAIRAAIKEQIHHLESPPWLEISGIEKQMLVPATMKHPKSSEGSMIELTNGDVLFMWSQFTDVTRMSPDENPPSAGLRRSPLSDDGFCRIVSMSSKDGGRTWSKPWVAIDDRDAEVNILSPGLTRLPDGRLMVAYSWRSSQNKTNKDLGDATKRIRFSEDEGKIWSDHREIRQDLDGYQTGCHDRSYTLESGRVIVQRHTLIPNETGFKEMGTYLSYSDDNGETWKRSELLTDAVNKHFEESSLVQRADGSLLMVSRASRGQSFFTESYDDGATWTKPYASGIVNTRAPTLLKRFPDSDDILMLWNSNYVEKASHGWTRTTLQAAVSKDGGKSWSTPKALESDREYQWAYPGLLWKDGYALIHYYRGPAFAGGREMVLARVPIDWFYSTEGSENVTRF
jgi:hypothetical protein